MIHWFFEISGRITAGIQAAPTRGTAAVTVMALIALGGLIAGISPEGLMGTLAVVGQVGTADDHGQERRGLLLAGAFSLGMVLALAALGLLTAFAGRLVLGWNLTRWLPLLTLVMGLNMLGLVHWKRFGLLRGNRSAASGPVSAFALGVPFGLAASPCTLPILITVLTTAVARGSAAFGLLGLTAFGLGRSVPVLLLGHASDQAQALPRLQRVTPVVRRAGGILIVVVSVYFLTLGRSVLA